MPSSLSKFANVSFMRGGDLFITGATEESTSDDVIFITVVQEGGACTQGRFVVDQPGGKDTWTATIPAGPVTPGPALVSGLLATFTGDPQFPGHKTFCWSDNITIDPLPTSKDDPKT